MPPKAPKRKMLNQREQIAERLKTARLDMDLTQMQLAEITGLGRSTIMHYENAKAAPGAMELLKLSEALDVSPNYLLSGRERFSRNTPNSESEASVDQSVFVSNAAILLMALEPDVRDHFVDLLKSMVQSKIGRNDFNTLMKALESMAPQMEAMKADVDAVAMTHFGEMVDKG